MSEKSMLIGCLIFEIIVTAISVIVILSNFNDKQLYSIEDRQEPSMLIVEDEIDESTIFRGFTLDRNIEPYARDRCKVSIDDDDIDLLSQLVYHEGRGESYECQQAIVWVVINRSEYSNDSISSVIYSPGQFETVSMFGHEEASQLEECRKVVEDTLSSDRLIPYDVVYFAAGKYHSTSYSEPFCQIDNTYFSRRK